MRLSALLLVVVFLGVTSDGLTFDGSTRRPELVKVKLGPLCNATKEGEFTVLHCICSDVKNLKLGYQTPHARKIFVRYFQTKSNGLRISECEEVHIYSSLRWVVPNMKTNPIRHFSVENIGSLFPYEARVFDFTFQTNISVELHFKHIRSPVKFTTDIEEFPTFKGFIKNISFESMSFLDFNTNGLYGISASEPRVTFRKCIIKTKDPGSESIRMKLSYLEIIDSSLSEAGRASFNISVPALHVLRSRFELISVKSLDIESDKTVFRDSNIGLQAHSLWIKSEVINFFNTTFNQPKTLSMIGLRPKSFNGPDIVRFNDITLVDPSRGALVTGGFHSIEFKGVVVSNCLCDLHEYLLDTSTSAFTLRMLPDFENYLQEELRNSSRCYDKNIHDFIEIETCDAPRFDAVYISLMSILFLGIISVIATILTVYLLNKRNRDQRIAIIKDWSIALPKPSSYRETMVKFNLESVQTFSRPSSIGYAEYKNESGFEEKVNDTKETIPALEENPSASTDSGDEGSCSKLGEREVKKALSVIIEEDDLISLEDVKYCDI